jgi:CO dehydrogenase nickel-insertion accessory protein CooC1
MANDLGIPRIFGVINKLRPGDDPGLIAKRLAEAGVTTIFAFPYDPAMEVADRTGVPVIDLMEGERMKTRLLELAEVIEKHMLIPEQVSQKNSDGTTGMERR